MVLDHLLRVDMKAILYNFDVFVHFWKIKYYNWSKLISSWHLSTDTLQWFCRAHICKWHTIKWNVIEFAITITCIGSVIKQVTIYCHAYNMLLFQALNKSSFIYEIHGWLNYFYFVLEWTLKVDLFKTTWVEVNL